MRAWLPTDPLVRLLYYRIAYKNIWLTLYECTVGDAAYQPLGVELTYHTHAREGYGTEAMAHLGLCSHRNNENDDLRLKIVCCQIKRGEMSKVQVLR